jgi:hypothetical protein
METDPQIWWKPDGRALSPSPILDQIGLSLVTGHEMRRALIHVDGVEDYTAVTAGMTGHRSSQKLPTGQSRVTYAGGLAVPPGTTETTVRVGVASEPLSPIRILDAQGQRIPAAADALPDHIREDIVVTEVKQAIDNPQSLSGGAVPSVQTELSYEIPMSWRQMDLRMVVIDKMGIKHYEVGSSYSIAENEKHQEMKCCSYFFPLLPTQIDRFEYQFRLYRHWVTFENVSLQPDRQTNVKITIDPDNP